MGCGASTTNTPARNLVLLGGGECGKTTIFKQIQILHGTGFKDKTMEWRDAIHRSPLRSMKVILTKMGSGEPGVPDEIKSEKEKLMGEWASASEVTPEIAKAITTIWTNPKVVEFIASEHELDLDDNAKFFLDKVEQLAAPDYTVTEADILKVRDPTRTIESLDFQYGKAKFRVIDVGGQRMERPKWNLTGEITAVIFVCALTEYNQVLREDIKQNRLKESLNLFDIACNRRYPDKPILLFLNKKDLFANKIQTLDLKCCFPSYKGGCDYDAALEYIKYKFLAVRKDKNKDIYIYETTATDSTNMEFIIKSMIDIVEKQNLQQSGFS